MADDMDAIRARLRYKAECLEASADSSYLRLDGPDAEHPDGVEWAVTRNAHAGREAMDIRALLDSEKKAREENERLEARVEEEQGNYVKVLESRDEKIREIARRTAEVEQLRADVRAHEATAGEILQDSATKTKQIAWQKERAEKAEADAHLLRRRAVDAEAYLYEARAELLKQRELLAESTAALTAAVAEVHEENEKFRKADEALAAAQAEHIEIEANLQELIVAAENRIKELEEDFTHVASQLSAANGHEGGRDGR